MDIEMLAADIANKQCSILQLIESLQPDLTSTKAEQRASAIGEVANVLQKLPPTHLNEQEVTTLVQFMCLKLSDHFSVSSHAISGLTILCGCINLSDAAAEAAFRSVSTELQVQTLSQTERMFVYKIYQLLLFNKLHLLKSINHDFVFGFVQAIDAEKDPRNLLIIFDLFPKVVAEFDISRFREDMFEVIACYFPIDFTPSGSGSVTREQLVELHTNCLASTPVFAEFMIPLLLEKLASDLRSARLESFNLLRNAAPVYPVEAILAYGQQLLAAFRRAMFRSAVADDERRTALSAFTAVAARIAGADQDNATARDEFFSMLLKECRPNLRELDPNVMEATGRALESASLSAGYEIRLKLLTGILPDILAGLADRKDSATKCSLLDILRRLLIASLSPSPSVNPAAESSSTQQPLVAHLSGELETIGAALYSLADSVAESAEPIGDQLRVGCLACMARLCAEPGLANCEQRAGFVEHLLGELGGHSRLRRLPGQLTRQLVRDFARRLATGTPDGMNEAANLVSKGFLPLATDHADADVRAESLLLLAELCDLPVTISEALLQLLMRLCVDAGSGAAATEEIRPRLEALRLATETAMASEAARSPAIGLWTGHFESFTGAFTGTSVNDVTKAASFVCVQAFARNLSIDDESSRVKPAIDWTVQQALTREQFCWLHCALLINLSPETVKYHAVALLPRLFALYLSDGAKFSLELYASLINKCLDYSRDPAMSAVEQRLQSDVDSVIADNSPADPRLASEFLAWCLKALLLSGSPLFSQLAERVLKILRGYIDGDRQGLAMRLASRLELLLTPCDRVLCSAAKASIGPLAVQKCLCLLLQPLLADARRNEACLLAAISLAQSASPDLIVDYIDSLIPALMLHLQPADEAASAGSLRAPILRLLETLASRQAALGAMAPRCLGDLLPRLLACLEPGRADLEARRASARLLRRLATGGLPTAELLPHRPAVVARLGAALNDPKRLARGDAARARNAWFLIG